MLSLVLPVLMLALEAQPYATRLKELVSIEGVRDNQLIGYGLVVGLKGTGDRQHDVIFGPEPGECSSKWASQLIRPSCA